MVEDRSALMSLLFISIQSYLMNKGVPVYDVYYWI
jgi:hypothetical protein